MIARYASFLYDRIDSSSEEWPDRRGCVPFRSEDPRIDCSFRDEFVLGLASPPINRNAPPVWVQIVILLLLIRLPKFECCNLRIIRTLGPVPLPLATPPTGSVSSGVGHDSSVGSVRGIHSAADESVRRVVVHDGLTHKPRLRARQAGMRHT